MTPQAQAGQYFVLAQDIIATGVSKNEKSGKHYMYIEFRTQHIANAAGTGWDVLPEPITRSIMLSLSDKAWDYTEKKLAHLGFNGNFDSPGFTKIADGLHVTCDIKPDREGNPRENWDISGWGSTERPEPDRDVITQLQARWKQNNQAAAPPVGNPAPPPTNPAPTKSQQGQNAQTPAPPVPAAAPTGGNSSAAIDDDDDPMNWPPKN